MRGGGGERDNESREGKGVGALVFPFAELDESKMNRHLEALAVPFCCPVDYDVIWYSTSLCSLISFFLAFVSFQSQTSRMFFISKSSLGSE